METEILTNILDYLSKKEESLPMVALVVWAELRFLPLVLDAIGWNRAIGASHGISDADMLAHRPKGLRGVVRSWVSRTPKGGPPPAAVAIFLTGLILFTK